MFCQDVAAWPVDGTMRAPYGCHMVADQPSMSIPEAAAKLRVSESSVRRWIKSGRLAAIRLPSGRRRVTERTLNEILRETASVA